MAFARPVRQRSLKDNKHNVTASWLAEVKNYGPSLDYLRPIWFEERTVRDSAALPPPHRHYYFEIGILLEGSVRMMVGTEETQRGKEELFIAGPAMPHCAEALSYPLRYCVVYFQPWILLESGTRDALRILERFAAGQPIHRYLIPLSKTMLGKFLEGFLAIKSETRHRAFGWELKLNALVVQMLVDLLRLDLKQGDAIKPSSSGPSDWEFLQKALNYISRHFAEPIYATSLARKIGITESRLQFLFRTLMGMTWVQYLQNYRIQRATALFSNRSITITEAAFAVGYESPSHFNATFLAITGMSPSRYRKVGFKKRHA